MKNKGNLRVAVSFIIVGVLAASLFGYALYAANHPSVPLADNGSNSNDLAGTSTPTDQQDSLPNQAIPSKTGITSRVSNDGDNDDDESDDTDNDSVKQTTPPPPVKTSTPPPATPPIDTTKRTGKYKDGTYTATGSYNSPGGLDQIGVSLTLSGDIITSVTATNMANDGTSSRYQKMFLSGYQSLVVGKNIDTLQLGKVSGSSLTGIGFNNALSQIKAQAKA